MSAPQISKNKSIIDFVFSYFLPMPQGIYFVGWSPRHVKIMEDAFMKYLGLDVAIVNDRKYSFARLEFRNKETKSDSTMVDNLCAEKTYSEDLAERWIHAIEKCSGIVNALPDDDNTCVRAAFEIQNCVAIDMHDIDSMKTPEGIFFESMNLFWVVTHEVISHAISKYGHGQNYKAYDLSTYSYKNDAALQQLNSWRLDMNLPTRLQHPPQIDGNTFTYAFIDYGTAENFDRKKRAEEEAKIRDSEDKSRYVYVQYVDDDSGKPGRYDQLHRRCMESMHTTRKS